MSASITAALMAIPGVRSVTAMALAGDAIEVEIHLSWWTFLLPFKREQIRWRAWYLLANHCHYRGLRLSVKGIK